MLLSFTEKIRSDNTQPPVQKQKCLQVACLDSPTEHFHVLLLQFEFISSYYWTQCELLVLLRKFGGLKKKSNTHRAKIKNCIISEYLLSTS